MSTVSQSSLISCTLGNTLIKLIKSVNFKEAHIAKDSMHLTETFPVKLLQIVVLDVSSKGPSSYSLDLINKKIKFLG